MSNSKLKHSSILIYFAVYRTYSHFLFFSSECKGRMQSRIVLALWANEFSSGPTLGTDVFKISHKKRLNICAIYLYNFSRFITPTVIHSHILFGMVRSNLH